jgi:hypothetical protein
MQIHHSGHLNLNDLKQSKTSHVNHLSSKSVFVPVLQKFNASVAAGGPDMSSVKAAAHNRIRSTLNASSGASRHIRLSIFRRVHPNGALFCSFAEHAHIASRHAPQKAIASCLLKKIGPWEVLLAYPHFFSVDKPKAYLVVNSKFCTRTELRYLRKTPD